MQNSDLCRSSDSARFRETDLFGIRTRVKSYICSPDGIHYRQKPEQLKLQVSVSLTSYCPASCPFCIAGDTSAKRFIDLSIFERTMRRLNEMEIVRGIKITGGEPMYAPELLDETVSMLYDIFGEELELSVSTNGIGLKRLARLKKLRLLESVHLSRHHYDDSVNRSIFGCEDVPSAETVKEVVNEVGINDLFVYNCMLLRDYIGTREEVHRFLDFAIETGVHKTGFVSVSPVNRFAAEQRVLYRDVLRQDDDALLFTRGFKDHEFCSCVDGVYASARGDIAEFYGRCTDDSECDYCRVLVYDCDNRLKTGYGGKILL